MPPGVELDHGAVADKRPAGLDRLDPRGVIRRFFNPRIGAVAAERDVLGEFIRAGGDRHAKPGVEILIVEVQRAHDGELGLGHARVLPRTPMVWKLCRIIPGDQLDPIDQAQGNADGRLRSREAKRSATRTRGRLARGPLSSPAPGPNAACCDSIPSSRQRPDIREPNGSG